MDAKNDRLLKSIMPSRCVGEFTSEDFAKIESVNNLEFLTGELVPDCKITENKLIKSLRIFLFGTRKARLLLVLDNLGMLRAT